MSFPRYPAYKESGVEWLEAIPFHWEVKRLKRICSVFPSNVDKKSVEGEHCVKLCNYTDVYYNDYIGDDLEFMEATATAEQIKKFSLKADDTIITKDSEAADDIAIAAYVPKDLPGVICGYHLSMVRPQGEISGAFVKRLFDSAYTKSLFAVRANGLTRVGLSQYAIDNVELPLPPREEQVTIAAFLDRETAKIDALIAEQQRMIELLQEKRQAVISHAVTKGLNPVAPMKDSGVEWLGEVPEHWEIKRIKHLARSISKGTTPTTIGADFTQAGIRFIKAENITHKGVLIDPAFYISEETNNELSRSILHGGEVLVVIAGATTGKSAVIAKDLCPANTNQAVCFIRTGCKHVSCYISHWLSQDTVQHHIVLGSVQSAQPNLSMEDLGNIPIALPPSEELGKIIDSCESAAEAIKIAISTSQNLIHLMQERRSALISAAVTGQIDVRGLVPEVSAA